MPTKNTEKKIINERPAKFSVPKNNADLNKKKKEEKLAKFCCTPKNYRISKSAADRHIKNL